jgi:ABC-2 type transport system permease protein
MNLSARALRPFGQDLFCFGRKFLVYNLVSRNLKIKYRRSILGVFWSMLSPIAMAGMYYFVFNLVLKVRMPHYLVFVLSGTLAWSYFAQTVTEGMESIVGNQSMVTKVPVPIQIFSLSGALTNLINLALSLPILVAAALLTSTPLGAPLLAVPFYIGALFLIAYGTALIFAITFVYFRDLRHILGIVMQVWMYATPIFYDEAMVPAQFRFITYLNPLAAICTGLHRAFVQCAWPIPAHIGIILAWVAIVSSAALALQVRFARQVPENL